MGCEGQRGRGRALLPPSQTGPGVRGRCRGHRGSIPAQEVIPGRRTAGDGLCSPALGRVAWCFGDCSADGLPAG